MSDMLEQLRAALVAADDALREHACHGGPSAPCVRSRYECASECGRKAGDALLIVEAALAEAMRDDIVTVPIKEIPGREVKL